jgi:hypothetical protein
VPNLVISLIIIVSNNPCVCQDEANNEFSSHPLPKKTMKAGAYNSDRNPTTAAKTTWRFKTQEQIARHPTCVVGTWLARTEADAVSLESRHM